MPAEQRGSAVRTGTGWCLRWYEDGKRRAKRGFRSKSDALAYFRDEVRPRLERRLDPALHPEVLTFDAFCELYLASHAPGRSPSTILTLRDRLVRPRRQF